MNLKRKLTLLLSLMVLGVIAHATTVFAFKPITAQEASDMVNSGQAKLVDVRTLEECLWVGMPDVTQGGLYVIPWEAMTIAPDGSVAKADNPNFDALITKTFGANRGQALIMMCRSGGRSTKAAKHLENDLGFTNVYEIDNPLKEAENGKGGNGGFQGTTYGDTYNGYRGYPKRLTANQSPNKTTVQTQTDHIDHADNSVSWMDTGLPVTQSMDKAIIPVLQ